MGASGLSAVSEERGDGWQLEWFAEEKEPKTQAHTPCLGHPTRSDGLEVDSENAEEKKAQPSLRERRLGEVASRVVEVASYLVWMKWPRRFC